MPPKASKQSVNYGVGHFSSHCGQSFDDDRGYCKHFIPPLSLENDLGQCRLVSGPINKVYWCKLWQRAQSR